MSTPGEAAADFVQRFEHVKLIEWWTSLALNDCPTRVYYHAVKACSCGRTQSQAYEAWRAQNPESAAEHDRRLARKAKDLDIP